MRTDNRRLLASATRPYGRICGAWRPVGGNLHGRAPLSASVSMVAEAAAFLDQNPQVQYVDCVFADLCGVVRGKRISRDDLSGVFEVGLAIPISIYSLDARGELAESGDGNAHGEAEGHAWPVAGTLTRVNWSQRPHGQVLMTLCDANRKPYFGEPRNVLGRVVERFGRLGLAPAVSCAFDFYLFDRDGMKAGVPQPMAGAVAPDATVYGKAGAGEFPSVISSIVEAGDTLGLPKVNVTTGALPGRFRIGVDAAAAVRAGDHAVFLRQIVRAVARKHGLDATFMAMPFLDLPGNGVSIGVELRDNAGRDVFGDAAAGRLGEAVLSSVGGLQAVMAESMAVFAPNVNGYRRFNGGGAVRNKRWGLNSAATVLNVTEAPRRIEHRGATADANPYLVIAAILAGIHYGLSDGLDPGQPSESAPAFVDHTLPAGIEAALLALENGPVLRDYLGPAYVDLYCAIKRAELVRFFSHIPAHEYDWYL